jgi:hypothetical protein
MERKSVFIHRADAPLLVRFVPRTLVFPQRLQGLRLWLLGVRLWLPLVRLFELLWHCFFTPLFCGLRSCRLPVAFEPLTSDHLTDLEHRRGLRVAVQPPFDGEISVFAKQRNLHRVRFLPVKLCKLRVTLYKFGLHSFVVAKERVELMYLPVIRNRA